MVQFLSKFYSHMSEREAIRSCARILAGQGSRALYADKVEGEPLLAEEAKVHVKEEHSGIYLIYFYIPARDTVVTCEVPQPLWHSLDKNTWGKLTHQGGGFFSFETEDGIYTLEGFCPPPHPHAPKP